MPNQYTSNPVPVVERFWSHVERSETCWTWTGYRDKDGYGKFTVERRSRLVHAYAWMLATGEWPALDMSVCHVCDVPFCVRNDDSGVYVVDGIEYERRGHLWLGTTRANQRDKAVKLRSAAGDRNGSRLYPERLMRGERHWAKTNPERVVRGDRHYARQDPSRMKRGEENGRATLTADLVRELRALRASGGNIAAFAQEHGLGLNAVHKAAVGRTWKHL